jgi:hypothetical protein
MILALVGTGGWGFAVTRGDKVAQPQHQRARYQRSEHEEGEPLIALDITDGFRQAGASVLSAHNLRDGLRARH